MGVMGAFVFAAQMINFPVGIGTSGHLVGGALLAMTLGPQSASIVMTAILVVQALLFQDGGVLALGANVLNMAIAGVWAGYLPYAQWGDVARKKAAIFLGGFLSVFVSACLAMTELRLSQVNIPSTIGMVSLGLFAVSAAVEGAITLAVVGALEKLNPAWVRRNGTRPSRGLTVILIAAAVLASIGALLASSLPDGLEKLAESLGIASRATSLYQTPLSDYEVRFLGEGWLRKALAGIAGLTVVYGVCMVAARLVGNKEKS
jgi:cobalt/nickel transport system permease protein